MSDLNQEGSGQPDPQPRSGARLVVLLVVGSVVAVTIYLVARKMLAPLMGG